MSQHVEIDDGLWGEFHRVVNMSSPELRQWLQTCSADERTEQFPDKAGPVFGRRVLQVLQKRRTDLNTADEQLIREVVELVHAEHGDEKPTAGSADWRHRLMSIGHDPLKEPR